MEDDQLVVFVTPKVAGRIARVHENTVRAHCRPEAWREDIEGKLHPVYTRSGIEAWRAAYRDGRLAGGDSL